MIKGLWNRYINWLLNYLYTDNELNQWKMGLVQFLTMGILGAIGIMVFYYFIGTSSIFASFLVSAGYGRLFFDWKLEKYDKNYPYDKRYIPFLRVIATSTIIFVTFGGTFILIKDAQENRSIMSKLSSNEQIKKSENIELNSRNQKKNATFFKN